MPDRFPELSVVLPAYNEARNIESVVNNVLQMLKCLSKQYEVILVNDGSRDETREIGERLAQENPCMTVIHHEYNQGYGAALRSGFSQAHYRFVFYTDADDQFDVDELQKFLKPIQECDLVIGYRIGRQDSRLRKFLAGGFNAMMRLIFQIKAHDIDCAFKLFRKEFLDAIALESNEFFIDAEILIKAKHYGYTVQERGVSHYPRKSGKTTVRPGHIAKTLWDILRFRIKLCFFKKSEKPPR